jgi:hypothetical protein
MARLHVVDRLKPFKRADFDRAEPIKAGGFDGLIDGIGNAVVAAPVSAGKIPLGVPIPADCGFPDHTVVYERAANLNRAKVMLRCQCGQRLFDGAHASDAAPANEATEVASSIAEARVWRA